MIVTSASLVFLGLFPFLYTAANVVLIRYFCKPLFRSVLIPIFRKAIVPNCLELIDRYRFLVRRRAAKVAPKSFDFVLAIFAFAISIWSSSKLRDSRDIGDIAWWWCVAALALIGALIVLSRRPLQFLNNHSGVFFKIVPALCVAGWTWYSSNEAATYLNSVFGLPGTDFKAAMTAMTVIFTVAGGAAVLGFLSIAVQFAGLIVILAHNAVKTTAGWGLLYLILLSGFIFFSEPVLWGLHRDVAIYFALEYDFNDSLICNSDQKPGGYIYIDANRSSALRVEKSEKILATFAERAKLKDSSNDRYFKSTEVILCDRLR